MSGKRNIAIGFVTGRPNFGSLIKTYIDSWIHSDIAYNQKYGLNLIITYDVNYRNTRASDYSHDECINKPIEASYMLGESAIQNEADYLIRKGIIDRQEARLVFGAGYAKKRNVILYYAVKYRMDYLLFIDDDEYPIAPLLLDGHIAWMGQQVLGSHMKHIEGADITHGYHCGYVSPIPYMEFNETMTGEDFKAFIQAISNDIISWESIEEKIESKGVTYAGYDIIKSRAAEEVEEVNGAKFISGSNLCINLRNAKTLYPFFNPPGARGEDTFLSTCLCGSTVKKVPCYAFHDGFATCINLLHGVLPSRLNPVVADSKKIVNRFMHACIGWIRYKPLYLYITGRREYDGRIEEMRDALAHTIPKLAAYFHNDGFTALMAELDKYHRDVRKHYEMFERTKEVWDRIYRYIRE
jgi:hypothetical protein